MVTGTINLETVAYMNEMVSEAVNLVIREAVDHFVTTSRSKKKSDDARYFYNKNELNTFMKLLDEPKYHKILSLLKVREIKEGGEFFCYEVSRI